MINRQSIAIIIPLSYNFCTYFSIFVSDHTHRASYGAGCFSFIKCEKLPSTRWGDDFFLLCQRGFSRWYFCYIANARKFDDQCILRLDMIYAWLFFFVWGDCYVNAGWSSAFRHILPFRWAGFFDITNHLWENTPNLFSSNAKF